LALIKWNPFLDFLTLEERMEQLFNGPLSKQKGCTGLSNGTWSPAVDIYETEDEITLSAELPGVEPDSVDVEVNKEMLTLSGKRLAHSKSEEQYLRMERCYGVFQRAFTLPAEVNKGGIKANFKDGVLRITLPKSRKPGPKRIKIDS
jgi:HSP20 family protein